MKHFTDEGDSTHNAILVILKNRHLSSKILKDSIQPRNQFSDLLVIMTNWQVPGQQQQYNKKLSLVGGSDHSLKGSDE
jgi:hypothetical protein